MNFFNTVWVNTKYVVAMLFSSIFICGYIPNDINKSELVLIIKIKVESYEI